MREVIRIPIEIDIDKKEEPVKITYYQGSARGWTPWITSTVINSDSKVVYLGKCIIDGDMFAIFNDEVGTILIAKGYLNSGKY